MLQIFKHLNLSSRLNGSRKTLPNWNPTAVRNWKIKQILRHSEPLQNRPLEVLSAAVGTDVAAPAFIQSFPIIWDTGPLESWLLEEAKHTSNNGWFAIDLAAGSCILSCSILEPLLHYWTLRSLTLILSHLRSFVLAFSSELNRLFYANWLGCAYSPCDAWAYFFVSLILSCCVIPNDTYQCPRCMNLFESTARLPFSLGRGWANFPRTIEGHR